MHKSLISKIFILLLVVGLLFAVAPTKQAQAATITVCPDGTCTYTTIQAAIDAATTVAGDTITVAAGTYVENVVVNKAITLQGAGATTTKIVATNGNSTPLTFSASGATVNGFELTHDYTAQELSDWTFNNNGVIFLQLTTENTLKNCKVTKSRNGIYINNARGNIIDGNTIENNRTGINLTNYVDETQIKNNIIRNNWTIGIVYYQGSAGLPTNFNTVTVEGNTFSNNWYSEILLKDNGSVPSADTGVLNVTNNTFGDTPITYSTSSDPSLNEPGFAAQKPVEFGGEATMPTTPLPTLRIYNVPGVTLQKDGKTLVVGAAPNFTTIQAAIDAAAAGDIISVMPGEYDETASNRTINGSGGVYQFGLFFEYAKPGITLQGVKADGSVITSASDVVASIKTNATNNFGYSGVFVDADNITITGLKFLDNYVSGLVDNNKTIEVIGNNFTYKNNVMSVEDGGSLYLNDWNYDAGNKISKVKAYNISDNLFKSGASVSISSGVGVSGEATGRVIANNTFTADGEDVTWASISFNGTVPSVGWYVYPVGGATITGNTFTGVPMPIRSRGIVEDDFDWASYATGNNFEKAVIAWDVTNNKPRAYDYISGTYTLNNVILIGSVIQDEIGHALPGDEVRVIKGTFVEDVVVDKDITLKGIPNPFATNPEVVIDGLVSLTADGATISNLKVAPGAVTGQVAAISVTASNTTVSGNLIDGMTGDSTASIKGIFVYGGSTTVLENITINGNTVKNISNPGTGVKGTDGIQIQGNLDGVIVENNIISAISSQGWAYGIEVTPSGANPTLPPQDVVIRGNTITNVSAVTYPGVALSIDQYNDANTADASKVIAELNRFNAMPVVNKDGLHSLLAEKNWWGTSAGPQPSMMYGTMDASPWCTNPECTLFAEAPVVTIAAVSPVVCGNTLTSTIDINVTDVPATSPLQGYQFRLNFDETKTNVANLATDIVNGGFILNGGYLVATWIDETTGAISTTPTGILDIGYTQFTPSASFGDGKLASITLTHLGVPGDIDFTLTNVVLSSRDGIVIPSEGSATATTLTLQPAVLNTTVEPDAGYCDLASAVAAASAGDNLQLQADITIPTTVSINKSLTLDLNGKVATYSPTENTFALNVDGATTTLTLIDGISPSTGKILVVDGDTDAAKDGRGIEVTNGGTLLFNSGTIEAPYAGVYLMENAKMTLNGGTVDSFYGLVTRKPGASLTVTTGTITADGFAISGNGSVGQAPTTILINGGTITSTATAIYHPQDGTLTINGGTISGYNGIEMKAGNLVVSDGTILGTGAFADPLPNDNGSANTGDAILLNGRDAYTGDITVTISGTPTITSTNAYALRDYKPADQALKTSAVLVSGGSFTGGIQAVTFSDAFVALPRSSTAGLMLTGGFYNTDPADPNVYVFVPYGTVYNGTVSMYEIVGISLNVHDFYYNTSSTLRGVSTDFYATNFVFSDAISVTVRLYAGEEGVYVLQQTNVLKVPSSHNTDVLTSSFDYFGTYVSNSWANTEASTFDVTAVPTRVEVTVVLPGGTLEGFKNLPTGDRTTILPGVSGLVTLQGILAPRAGVPIYLTSGLLVRDTTSTEMTDINYWFTGVETLTYTFTTTQARYLNVTTASGKTFLVDRDLTLNPLRLYGGDVDQNNVIQVNDASLVGAAWGSTVDSAANINYDGIVNIQDLALVGGNFGLTSATAYNWWSPLP